MNIKAIFKLTRISALPSAFADIFGGMALVFAYTNYVWGSENTGSLLLVFAMLLIASFGIYLGGMASNDVLHVRKDRRLEKNRPLVTGELSLPVAIGVTVALYAIGLIGAWFAGCFVPALILVGLTLLYNAIASGTSKLAAVASVPVIAVCRALHVALPLMCFLGATTALGLSWGALATVAAYFVLVTGISLFEDTGGGKNALVIIGMCFVPALFWLLLWYVAERWTFDLQIIPASIVLVGLVGLLWRRLIPAIKDPKPSTIGPVVGEGIRGECLLMAAFGLLYALSSGLWVLALACWIVATWLGKRIKMT